LRIGNCECNRGLCCTHIKFIVPKIITRDEEKYYKLRGIEVKKSKGKTILRIPARCIMLTHDFKCRSYENRPIICQRFPEKKEDLIKGCTYRFD
jgi:Fe-S-cluster containining protein